MATCTFNQLLYALRVSVEAANEALHRRRLMQYEAATAGGQALHVDVPRDSASDAPLESVVIPLNWFRDPSVPLVTELSLEFGCRLRYERGSAGTGGLVIELRPAAPTWFRRSPVHRMRIVFRAANAWEPSVAIDGRVVNLPKIGRG